jgi:hypothetical protein
VGCGLCYGASLILSFFSYGLIASIVSGNAADFAIPYCISTILNIFASMFLFNPKNQVKKMF